MEATMLVVALRNCVFDVPKSRGLHVYYNLSVLGQLRCEVFLQKCCI
jgi:hypothetical protein